MNFQSLVHQWVGFTMQFIACSGLGVWKNTENSTIWGLNGSSLQMDSLIPEFDVSLVLIWIPILAMSATSCLTRKYQLILSGLCMVIQCAIMQVSPMGSSIFSTLIFSFTVWNTFSLQMDYGYMELGALLGILASPLAYSWRLVLGYVYISCSALIYLTSPLIEDEITISWEPKFVLILFLVCVLVGGINSVVFVMQEQTHTLKLFMVASFYFGRLGSRMCCVETYRWTIMGSIWSLVFISIALGIHVENRHVWICVLLYVYGILWSACMTQMEKQDVTITFFWSFYISLPFLMSLNLLLREAQIHFQQQLIPYFVFMGFFLFAALLFTLCMDWVKFGHAMEWRKKSKMVVPFIP